MSKKGQLCLIPVPLSDAGTGQMSAEALNAAHQIHYFVSERPKTSRKWIKDIGHPSPQSAIEVVDIVDLKEPEFMDAMVRYLNTGKDVGLVSEAGMPCIADPGFELVATLRKKGFEIRPFSGPNSMMMALMASGLPGQKFCFHGYLSSKKEELREDLIKLSKTTQSSGVTQIFMETPYRNKQVFTTLLNVCPQDLWLCVASQLGASGERIHTAKIRDWKDKPLEDFHDKPSIFILAAGEK